MLATVNDNNRATLNDLCRQINEALRTTGDQIRSDIGVAMDDAIASVPRYVMFQPGTDVVPSNEKRVERDDKGRIVKIIEA